MALALAGDLQRRHRLVPGRTTCCLQGQGTQSGTLHGSPSGWLTRKLCAHATCCNCMGCSARLDCAAPYEALALPTPISGGDCLQDSHACLALYAVCTQEVLGQGMPSNSGHGCEAKPKGGVCHGNENFMMKRQAGYQKWQDVSPGCGSRGFRSQFPVACVLSMFLADYCQHVTWRP